MIITSHMQKIIQIYPCLLKLSRKQDTILKIGDFSTKNKDFPPKSLLQILPCKNPSKIMIITSHMQKIIQIHPCLLKLSRKEESVMDGRYNYIPHRYRGVIKNYGVIFILSVTQIASDCYYILLLTNF